MTYRRNQPTDPPPFKGGQGRTDREVIEGASAIAWMFAAGFVLLAVLFLGSYCHA